jgi:hypothetical protein
MPIIPKYKDDLLHVLDPKQSAVKNTPPLASASPRAMYCRIPLPLLALQTQKLNCRALVCD